MTGERKPGENGFQLPLSDGLFRSVPLLRYGFFFSPPFTWKKSVVCKLFSGRPPLSSQDQLIYRGAVSPFVFKRGLLLGSPLCPW